jgi:hypothetical protein
MNVLRDQSADSRVPILLLSIAYVIVFSLVSEQASADDYQRSSYIKKFPSCALISAHQQITCASESRCKYACLESACAAFEYNAVTGVCRMQDAADFVPTASPEQIVHFMMAEFEPEVNCVLDCADILARDASSQSGVYDIFLRGQTRTQVYCDMDTDGGGWTVFLRRFDGSVDFYRDRATYKAGFGALDGEHWLGLDTLHALTSFKSYQLRGDVSDWVDDTAYSLHDSVVVGDEASEYILTLGPFLEGNGGDGLRINNGQRFTTFDRDRDSYSTNCAIKHKGGWWYSGCSVNHATAKYYTGGTYSSNNNDGMQWRSWTKHDNLYYAMKTLNIKIRP